MSKKILHIIDNLWLGGAQIVVKWIFENQVLNNDIFLFSVRKTQITTEINHQNIIQNNCEFKHSFPIFKLKKIIKDNNINILHCHLAKSQIIWGILKTLFFPDLKLVFHEHWEIFENWKIYPFFMSLFKDKINLFIAVSNLTKEKILYKTKIDSYKINVLYNFVDLNKFKKISISNKNEYRSKYNLEKDDFVLWFAARLIERKWWFEFVEAAKILRDKWYEFKFLIAWDWIDKEKIIEFINKNKLENNIKMIWYIKDMNIFYNMIDIFVFSSHWEPLWLTWIEANAASCPLIASDIPWLNEIIVNNVNAMLFKKEDAFDLSWKIVEMYEEIDVKNELIKSSLKEVKKYSLDKYINKLNDLYNQI